MAKKRKADLNGTQQAITPFSSSTTSPSMPRQSTTRRRTNLREMQSNMLAADGGSGSGSTGAGAGANIYSSNSNSNNSSSSGGGGGNLGNGGIGGGGAGAEATPKVINAAPSLEKAEMYGIDDERPASSKFMALMGRIFIETIPQWLAVGGMLSLIFGGCCSNVFSLEAIVKVEPDSGTLLTFVQFAFVAATGYVSQFDVKRPPFFLKPNRVPIKRWLINIVLFFSINVLNNHAFSYNISVPVHIILRSGGSITTMVAGYLFGKRYSRLQIISVVMLTVGVIIAAWFDAQSKDTTSNEKRNVFPFSTGLAILFLAQVLSSIMGLYTEDTYREYGPHWKENLFYSHLLSLPLFIPFFPSMREQFLKLASSPPLPLLPSLPSLAAAQRLGDMVPAQLNGGGGGGGNTGDVGIAIPSQLAYMLANVLTQYACIRGVNLLAASASALTVTIVLNVRKLVSLLLSIWLFGNRLSPGTMLGAVVVFTAGGMYSMDGSRGRVLQRRQRTTQQAIGGGGSSGGSGNGKVS